MTSHKSSGDYDPYTTLSGSVQVKVPTSEDTSIKQLSGTHYIHLSGQTSPSGAWYQQTSGSLITPNVPNTQITLVINSVQPTAPNQALAPFQSSGNSAPTANVPKSESSWNH